MYSYTLSLSSALDGVEDKRHTPTALPQEKRTGTNNTAGRVDPTAGLNGCGKSLTPGGFEHWTVQTLTSSYTD